MDGPIRPTDPQLYLGRVAAQLGLPPGTEQEVVEELAAHIADATAALVAEGLTAAQAEREALARLGSPETLADEIRRAQQTTRRLAVAGVHGLGWLLRTGVFWTLSSYLFVSLAYLVLMAAAMALALPDDALGQWGGASDSIGPFAVGLVLGAFFGAREAVLVMARGSRRPAGRLGRWLALLGTPPLAVWSIAILGGPLDPIAVAMLLLVPVAFAAGCLAGPRVHWPARPLRWAAAAGVATLVLVLVATVGQPRSRTYGTSPISTDMGFERVAPEAPAERAPLFDLGGWSSVEGGLDVRVAPAAAAAGWHDLRFEAWRGALAGSQGIAPDAAAPYAVAAAVERDGTLAALVPVAGNPRVTHFWIVLTGEDAAGQRYRLAPPSSGWTAFRGTALDWLGGMVSSAP